MIVGNGLMANSFETYKNNNEILVFASGVSNSKDTNKKNFDRERLLLEDIINKNPEKVLVYFSTCSVYDHSVIKSSYVKHKKEMELIIGRKCNKFYIFRLPTVVGNTNSSTLVKFLFESILSNRKVDINKKSTRNLISVDDVFVIIDYLLRNNLYINEVTNIATPNNTPVIDIVKIIEEITDLSLKYKQINTGHSFNVDIEKIRNLNIKFRIFSCDYLYKVLHSYFLSAYSNKSSLKI